MLHFTQFHIQQVSSPYWAFAIHDGQDIHPALLPYQLLKEQERLREEDPFTAKIADLPINQFIVKSSRFQLDINRKLEDAIYLKPAQAWGLEVWKDTTPANYIAKLQDDHQNILQTIVDLVQETIHQFGYFVIYDIHSYNAKRHSSAEVVNELENPQINLGTGPVHSKWRPLITLWMDYLKTQTLYGEVIDIRENVKFRGGYLSQMINERFAEFGCVLSIEFRKDFMDEWTAVPNHLRIQSCKELLSNSLEVLNNYFDDHGKK
ncbi:N-formylglutamate amidohydrolase [Sphingobacterium sp. HJSM2_6]|uniref:N-formylglutamate amidohydrolase n=1 Tax=Sphingobacterium sp. HJSM2_6 TaxID=3366264 RepID=UPI003BCF6030